jgi:hypothetical protein
MKSAVEWLVKELESMDTKSYNSLIQIEMDRDNFIQICEQAKEIEVNLAQQYAEFSILCDRRGMKIVKFKDWCEQYDKKTI